MLEKAIFTNMCMIRDRDKILVQNRIKPDWSGVTFPGGHVEPNESFVESVIREVKEETGLLISNPHLCGIKQWICDDNTRYIVICYTADEFSGTLKSSREGDVFWTTPDDMLKMNLANGMDYMIKLFTDDNISEHRVVKNGDTWRNIIY